MIWDVIVIAYLLNMTDHVTHPRPAVEDDASFGPLRPDSEVTWITDLDENRMWADFLAKLDRFQKTHRIGSADQRD